jgi:CheY-like chemotaxis protein
MARVLVVDDEPLIAMMIAGWLEELGHQPVGPAGTVSHALAHVGEGGIDAVILDLSLGDESSYSVAEALAGQGIPFAFATGHGSSTIEAAWAGRPLLPKPFVFANVQETVAQLLGG